MYKQPHVKELVLIQLLLVYYFLSSTLPSSPESCPTLVVVVAPVKLVPLIGIPNLLPVLRSLLIQFSPFGLTRHHPGEIDV